MNNSSELDSTKNEVEVNIEFKKYVYANGKSNGKFIDIIDDEELIEKTKICNKYLSVINDNQNLVLIIFVRSRDIKPAFLNKIVELRSDVKYSRIPFIVIGPSNLMLVFDISVGDENNKITINKKNELLQKIKSFDELDLRYRFLDSSIWNYYVFPESESLLFETLKEITKNYKNKRYQSNVGYEFIEVQNRLMKESYIKPSIDNSIDQKSDTHATFVTPFKFHSERYFNCMLRTEMSKIEKFISNKIEWCFLLIDDYAIKPLSGTDEKVSKYKIIKDTIEKDFSELFKKSFPDLGITIDFATSGEMAFCENCIKDSKNDIECQYFEKKCNDAIKEKLCCSIYNKKYDLILLDYLLDYLYDEKNLKKAEREFGNNILEKINRCIESNLPIKKGPMNKFWIFPVSVFGNAMLDSMREQGLSHISEHWYISRGADPLNTPELFRYELFSFIKLMINEATFNRQSIALFFSQHMIEENLQIRQWAQTHIGLFMQQFGRIAQLEDDANWQDIDKGSKFAQTFLNYYKDKYWVDYQIAEHLRDLLYNLAYGTVRERDTMLENISFLEGHSQLIKIFEKEIEKETSYSRSIGLIKNYVLKLPD